MYEKVAITGEPIIDALILLGCTVLAAMFVMNR